MVAVRSLGAEARLTTWRREATGYQADAGASDRPLAVGSLQKPFVAKAWASAHPGATPPRGFCDGTTCWLRAGHGEVDLVRALAVSCNTYFRQLAADTPPPTLAAILGSEGFTVPQTLAPDAAIGLPGREGVLRIQPSALLESYTRLVRAPWPAGEPIRRQVLAGLREAAGPGGTAAGLGRRGFWAKTGTVAAPGDPLHTWGLALAVDDTGWAILGRLEPGTGREAAEALAVPLSRLRPWNPATGRPARSPGTSAQEKNGITYPVGRLRAVPDDSVTVRLFELLAPRRLRVLNLGTSPVPTSGGYLGPGASLDLRPQEWVGAGLLEIQAPELGLIRRVRAELSCRSGPSGSLRASARLTRREYVAGVLMAELPGDSSVLHTELGAAVVRFLGRGARHAGADVCDTTHCAWFVGRGPRLDWAEPRRAVLLPGPAGAPDLTLDDAEWARILEAARRPGPSQWTSHCGGRPLSSHAVWGTGDSSAVPCPRHGAAETRPWARVWSAKDVGKAFGGSVRAMSVEDEDGVWVLRVEGPEGTRAWRYDEAHRRLAGILGWGSLPSPAERIETVPAGFRAQGVGLGHRVGLCLAD